ncbi:hypothetical protein [Streptomyces sp. S186]|uniref:hypothetical protein n=1 Tax=Streptomyces sp. S186 TaxID=3434395 RepID=UPI003F6727C1
MFSRDAEERNATVAADLTTERRDDSLLEVAFSRLSLDPAVPTASWTVISHRDEDDGNYPADEAPRRRLRDFFTGWGGGAWRR